MLCHGISNLLSRERHEAMLTRQVLHRCDQQDGFSKSTSQGSQLTFVVPTLMHLHSAGCAWVKGTWHSSRTSCRAINERQSGLRCARQAQAHVVALLEIVSHACLLAVQIEHHAPGPAICQAFHLQVHNKPGLTAVTQYHLVITCCV